MRSVFGKLDGSRQTLIGGETSADGRPGQLYVAGAFDFFVGGLHNAAGGGRSGLGRRLPHALAKIF